VKNVILYVTYGALTLLLSLKTYTAPSIDNIIRHSPCQKYFKRAQYKRKVVTFKKNLGM